MTAAAITPGIDNGSVTLRNVLIGLSPRSAEASRSERSIFESDRYIGRMANAAHAWTSVRVTANLLYNRNSSGPWMNPSSRSVALTTPLLPSIIFQASTRSR